MDAVTDRITRADIVSAALALLARGGLHGLAMRRIAAEVGVQQSALYWHFDNKQQLLGAVADRIVAPVDAADDAEWQERVVTLATRLRAELLIHPDGAELVATAVAFRLGAHRPFEQFTDALERAGLTRDDAGIATSVLVHFVLGYTTDEQQHRQAAVLGAIEDDGRTDSPDDRFVRGVRLIVAGVASIGDPQGDLVIRQREVR